MGTLAIHDDACRLGIINPAACLITDVEVRSVEGVLDTEISALLRTLRDSPETILARREVAGFDELFARMGYGSEVIPAGKHRVQLFQRRGFPRHNNLIDAYNIATAEFGASLSLHDASRFQHADLHVFRARGCESIRPMFKESPVAIPAGDIVSATDAQGTELLAAVGKWDVDSEDFKVTDSSTSLLLVVLGNAATPYSYNREVCDRVLDLILRTCPAANAEFLQVVRRAGLAAQDWGRGLRRENEGSRGERRLRQLTPRARLLNRWRP